MNNWKDRYNKIPPSKGPTDGRLTLVFILLLGGGWFFLFKVVCSLLGG